jgi:septal ring factor EnvC (AmiA/AmiB activator)
MRPRQVQYRRSACGRMPAPGRMVAVLVLCAVGITALADPDNPPTEAELGKLRNQIEQLRQSLTSAHEKEDALTRALSRAESAIGAVTRELHELDLRSERLIAQLKQMSRERDELKRRLASQREHIEREARAAYAMGQQGQLKLLLSQEDADSVGRMMTYYGYLTRARISRTAEIRDQIARLDEVEQSIEREDQELARVRERRAEEKRRLEALQTDREEALASLRADISGKGTELKQLERNENELKQLVAKLRAASAETPVSNGQHTAFASLKGRLSWPTAGKISTRFGQRKPFGQLKSNGVMIAAQAGAEVRAVSRGRVVFADWLRGFGLLLIVDHGDGYMSLYGHNQTLYKDVGDPVGRDEIVGLVGSSGGQDRSGLYFELRRNGRPVDPVAWCAHKPPQQSGGG